MTNGRFWVLFLLLSGEILCSLITLAETSSDSLTHELVALNVNRKNEEFIEYAINDWLKLQLSFYRALEASGVEALLNYTLKCDQYIKVEQGNLAKIYSTLTKEHFSIMRVEVCAKFAENLHLLMVDPLVLPQGCRDFLLKYGTIKVPGIKMMPLNWLMEIAGKGFIGRLTGEHLNNLSKEVFYHFTLLESNCSHLDSLSFAKLDLYHWNQLSPSCLANTQNLKSLKLSKEVLHNLREDIFSAYDGPLHQETISGMTPAQAKYYASRLPKHSNYICKDFHIKYLSWEAASMVTCRCLYGYLWRNGRKAQPLEGHWTALEVPFLEFTEEMMDNIWIISFKEYNWMPFKVLDKIFTSRAAVNRICQDKIYASILARSITLNATHFKYLVESSGEVAAMFITFAHTLPDDTFSYFTADDYLKLELSDKVYGGVSLSGVGLVASLERHPNFDKIVANLSINVDSHFCSILESQEQYLKLFWLREYGGVECHLALEFTIDDEFCSKAPELYRRGRTWVEFIEQDSNFWKGLSISSLKDLLEMPSFCMAAKNILTEEILEALPCWILNGLNCKCSLYLYKSISPSLVRKLPADTFKFFSAEMFQHRLTLSDLTPAQIGKVSQYYDSFPELHLFSHVKGKEILSLDQDQVLAITMEQLNFFLGNNVNIEDLQISLDFIKLGISLKSERFLEIGLEFCQSQLKNNQDKEEALECVRMIEEGIKYERPNSNNNGTSWNRLREKLEGFELLSLTILERPMEICKFLFRTDFPTMAMTPLSLTYDDGRLKGFDFAESLRVLQKSPGHVANPLFSVKIVGKDFKGVQVDRWWISEMLDKIRDLITVPVENGDPTYRRFYWRVKGDIGHVAGLLFGKALQRKVQPSFELEKDFWNLFINLKDSMIDEYFEKSLYREKLESWFDSFLLGILEQDSSFDSASKAKTETISSNDDDIVIPRVESMFSKEVVSKLFYIEEGTFDYKSPSITSRIIDSYLALGYEQDQDKNFENDKDSFSTLDKAIKANFHSFIQNFQTGLSMTLKVESFKQVKRVEGGPFSFFKLPPIQADDVINNILFERSLADTQVNSFILPYKLSLSIIIKSFIKALSTRQLYKLLMIWNEYPYLSPSLVGGGTIGKHLSISSLDGRNVERAIGDFVNGPPPTLMTERLESEEKMILRGEYQNVIQKAASIQAAVLGLGGNFSLDLFDDKTLTLLLPTLQGQYFKSTISTKLKQLNIYPQPSWALFYSLLQLLVG